MPASAGIACEESSERIESPGRSADADHGEIRSRGGGSKIGQLSSPEDRVCRRGKDEPDRRPARDRPGVKLWLFCVFFGGHVICSREL